ncbi:MAG: glutathionyl-hydroquinone reductase [Shewanella psychromarinicola]|jgi:glutathionyl-hydroquinone reductase
MRENGWEFANANGSRIGRHITGAQVDPVHQKDFLYQLYQFAKPQYNGRVTVPVLWDKKPTPLSVMNHLKSSECLTVLSIISRGMTSIIIPKHCNCR